MRSVRRTYKDSLFRDIFNDTVRLSDVYTALMGERAEPSEIRLTTIDEIFFGSEKNDVSFLVQDRHIVLLEHQSTVNANMPLRLLWYVAELYRQYVDPKAPYRSKRIALPAPTFYVFYNGWVEMPQEWQLRLSDSFGDAAGAMELIVNVLNINAEAGHPILARCLPLRAYSAFVAKVRDCVHSGTALVRAVPEAIRYCIAHNYLPEYFTNKLEKEVFDMVNFEWDEELARQVRAEEAWEDGMESGRQQGMQQGMQQALAASIGNLMKSMNFSVEKAMDVLQIPPAERAKYAALVQAP